MTKPSSAAFPRNVWIPLEGGTGLEIAKDSVETDPFAGAGASAVAITPTEAGLGGGAGLTFPVKSLMTCKWNSPS